MVSPRGHGTVSPVTTASDRGEIEVEEYGYGLGPPTGMLLLRYPPGPVVPDFPESREDHLHQLFWTPDGALGVRRGLHTAHLGPGEALWVRRGTVAAAAALERETVIRICLREAPPAVTAVSAGVLTLPPAVGEAVLSAARPGCSEEHGLAVRETLLAALAAHPPTELAFTRSDATPLTTVVETLLRDPADSRRLADWADELHVSTKTLQRDFQRNYDMTFTQWRTDVRLRASLALLGRLSVTETAHRVGYSSPSAFVAAFTRAYGETPGRLTVG